HGLSSGEGDERIIAARGDCAPGCPAGDKKPASLQPRGRGNKRSLNGWRAERWPPRRGTAAVERGSGAGRGGLARRLLARGGALGGRLRGFRGLLRGRLLLLL